MTTITPIDTKRRATYRGEGDWLPLLEVVGPSRLRRAFIDCGVSPQVAGNLVWFLEDQALLADFAQSDHTRTRYRRILAELSPEEVRAAARTIPGQFKVAA